MNPTRKRRLWLVLAVVAAAAIATTLIAMALQRNVAYLYTPSEVLKGEAGERARFRLGGGLVGQVPDLRHPLRRGRTSRPTTRRSTRAGASGR